MAQPAPTAPACFHTSFTAQLPFPAKCVRLLNRYANYYLMETRERDRFN